MSPRGERPAGSGPFSHMGERTQRGCSGGSPPRSRVALQAGFPLRTPFTGAAYPRGRGIPSRREKLSARSPLLALPPAFRH